jgi:isoleucyl-tRNA synthetase
LAETLWQNLRGTLSGVRESVHLCDYPAGTPGEGFAEPDALLSQRMNLLREIASLGRSARMDSKLKVRQPLQRVEVSLADELHIHWLRLHDDIVRDELNVDEIHYASGTSPFVDYQVLPNFRKLGPKVGRLLPSLKQALANVSGASLLSELTEHGKITLSIDDTVIELDSEDIQVRMTAKTGWAAAQGKLCVVALNTELNETLIRRGIAKDAVRLIQDLRKKRDCNFTDRISVWFADATESIQLAVRENEAFVRQETLANQLLWDSPAMEIELDSVELDDASIRLGLRVD